MVGSIVEVGRGRVIMGVEEETPGLSISGGLGQDPVSSDRRLEGRSWSGPSASRPEPSSREARSLGSGKMTFKMSLEVAGEVVVPCTDERCGETGMVRGVVEVAVVGGESSRMGSERKVWSSIVFRL